MKNNVLNSYVGFFKMEIINEIVSLAKDFGLCAEDLDTKFVHLRGDGWSIEFCFWDEEEPYETMEMQIRGIRELKEIFARLQQDLDARIFDMHRGKFI